MAGINSKEVVDANGMLPIIPSSNIIAKMLVEKDSEYYNMNHPKRGKALIFNQEYFEDENLKRRTGTATDSINLETQLTNLDFDVEICNDLKFCEIISKVDEIAKLDHSENDCFLIAILTHGDAGFLYAKDHSYNLDLICSKLSANNCLSLAGKPKIFIIQACRGRRFDTGVTMMRSRIEVDGQQIESYRIPAYSDFLIAYSTADGYYSFRDTEYGSWFIQSLCKELEINGKNLDFQRILTNVCRRVAIDYGRNVIGENPSFVSEQKQMPCISSMLTRLIQFSNKQ